MANGDRKVRVGWVAAEAVCMGFPRDKHKEAWRDGLVKQANNENNTTQNNKLREETAGEKELINNVIIRPALCENLAST